MKRAFGMPRGFFSPSWMMSGGVFEVDILSLQNERETDNNRSNLCTRCPELANQEHIYSTPRLLLTTHVDGDVNMFLRLARWAGKQLAATGSEDYCIHTREPTTVQLTSLKGRPSDTHDRAARHIYAAACFQIAFCVGATACAGTPETRP